MELTDIDLGGLQGAGGDMFLSGSIAVALRNCYEGIIGFRPDLEHVAIDPCIPSLWEKLEAEVVFLGGRYRICVDNPRHSQVGVAKLSLNGREITDRVYSARFGRELAVIPVRRLRRKQSGCIEVEMK